MHWKNKRPEKHHAYEPTNIEHVANVLSHGIWVLPAGMLSFNMLSSAKTPDQQFASMVYGLVLTGLFGTSTLFHAVAGAPCSRTSAAKHVLHRCDRAMIYLFIAGSATPWLVLRSFPEDGFARHLRWAVWVLAALGILYQQIFHERYKWLETTFYVLIGSTPCLALGEMEDLSGLSELRWGGLAYLCGVFFFKSDGFIPMAHAIWHLHVVVGAFVHFYAVSTYLIPLL